VTRLEDELGGVASQLEALSEQLGDLAIERLREAAEGDAEAVAEAVATERRLNRARRSVDKAVVLLRGSGDAEG
jgi:acyl-coenzyme A thioesterase PaaI-like protein